jgi:hypothetical protein
VSTPENQMDPAAPPAEGDGQEGAMEALIDFVRGLFVDDNLLQQFQSNPAGTLEQSGLAGVDGAQVHQALGVVADTLPPQQAAGLSSYANSAYQGQVGGGAGAIQSAVQEINYAVNLSYVDDRDNIIQDNDTNVAIGFGSGDVGITVDEDNQYAAAGDDATNVDIESTTTTPPATTPEEEPPVMPGEEPPGEGEVPPEEEPPGEGYTEYEPAPADYVPLGERPIGEALGEQPDFVEPEPPGGPPLTPPPEGP